MINVKVNTHSKNNSIILQKGIYKVNLTTKPIDGQANIALIKLLADYFSIPKSQISIIKGERAKNKVVEIK